MEAAGASARAADMKAAGASRVVGLVKENIGTEVEDFRKGFWSEEVLLDADLAFFRALGGGSLNKPVGLAAFLAIILNPFSKARLKGSHARSKEGGFDKDANMIGEGFATGGVYVIRQDGQASYTFLEEEIGDHPPIEDVIAGVEAAVRGEVHTAAPQSMPGMESEPGQRKQTWKEWAGRSDGPDGYRIGDITRGLARCRRGGARSSHA